MVIQAQEKLLLVITCEALLAARLNTTVTAIAGKLHLDIYIINPSQRG
jgi:hypothetical protein